jgi:hypothetical protein
VQQVQTVLLLVVVGQDVGAASVAMVATTVGVLVVEYGRGERGAGGRVCVEGRVGVGVSGTSWRTLPSCCSTFSCVNCVGAAGGAVDCGVASVAPCVVGPPVEVEADGPALSAVLGPPAAEEDMAEWRIWRYLVRETGQR